MWLCDRVTTIQYLHAHHKAAAHTCYLSVTDSPAVQLTHLAVSVCRCFVNAWSCWSMCFTYTPQAFHKTALSFGSCGLLWHVWKFLKWNQELPGEEFFWMEACQRSLQSPNVITKEISVFVKKQSKLSPMSYSWKILESFGLMKFEGVTPRICLICLTNNLLWGQLIAIKVFLNPLGLFEAPRRRFPAGTVWFARLGYRFWVYRRSSRIRPGSGSEPRAGEGALASHNLSTKVDQVPLLTASRSPPITQVDGLSS